MIPASLTSSLTIVFAVLLMVVAGITHKRLEWRTVRCPVCHHRSPFCTCHLR